MGITPQGVLISDAYTSIQEHKEHPQREQSKYINSFKNPEEIKPRELCNDNEKWCLQTAQEHFLNKIKDEEAVKKRTLHR